MKKGVSGEYCLLLWKTLGADWKSLWNKTKILIKEMLAVSVKTQKRKMSITPLLQCCSASYGLESSNKYFFKVK